MKCSEAEGKGKVRMGIGRVLETLSVFYRKDERHIVYEACFLHKEGDVSHLNGPRYIKVRPGSREELNRLSTAFRFEAHDTHLLDRARQMKMTRIAAIAGPPQGSTEQDTA